MKSMQPEMMLSGGSGSPPKMSHSDSYHSFFEDPYHHQQQQQSNVGLSLQQPQAQQQFFDASGRSLGLGGGRNSFNAGSSRNDQFNLMQQQQQHQMQQQQHQQQGMGYQNYGSPGQRSHY